MKELSDKELAEIGATIDRMDAICDKGRKQVKELVEKLVGKKLVEDTTIRLTNGQIYRADGWLDMMVIRSSDLDRKKGFSLVAISENRIPLHRVDTDTPEEWLRTRCYKLIGTAEVTIKPLA